MRWQPSLYNFSSMNLRRRQAGLINILTAITGIALLGLMGLALDTARVYYASHQLTVASDSAALAGAPWVVSKRSDAYGKARWAARQTGAPQGNMAGGVPLDFADGDLEVGFYDANTKTFTPTTISPNAMRVTSRRDSIANQPLPLIFGPIFGSANSSVLRSSVALAGPHTGSGLFTLAPSGNTFLMGGSFNLNVRYGDVHVNSSSPDAAASNGSANYLTAPSLDIVGGSTLLLDGGSYSLNTAADLYDDPCMDLVEPGIPGAPQPDGSRPNATLNAGYYPNGISRSHTLHSGVYYLEGALDIGANDTLQVEPGGGVMIFLAGTASVKIAGGATVLLSPPSSGAYAGVTIFQSRSDTMEAVFTGGGTINVNGTLYFPAAQLTVHGTIASLGTQVIANTFRSVNGADVTINYNGNFPNLSSPAKTAWLVK